MLRERRVCMNIRPCFHVVVVSLCLISNPVCEVHGWMNECRPLFNLMNVIPVTQGNCTAKQRQNTSERLWCGQKRYKKSHFPFQRCALNNFMLYLRPYVLRRKWVLLILLRPRQTGDLWSTYTNVRVYCRPCSEKKSD